MARPFAGFPLRAPMSGVRRLRRRGQSRVSEGRAIAVEPLEARHLLAVTASLVGTDLSIVFGADGDQGSLTSDGASYRVEGTGLKATSFAVSAVDSITVADAGKFANQAFSVNKGLPVVDRLVVNASIESTAINGVLDVGSSLPGMSIGSPLISLGADVTTLGGSQFYGGLVTLAASTVTLTGTAPTFSSGMSGVGNSLALNFSATTAIDGALFAGIKNLSTGNGGSTTLTGKVTTTGSQTYGDAVTLLAATTLSGTSITTNSTVAGGGNALAVVGDAAVNGAISGVSNYSVSETTKLGGDVTTTGSQTYGFAVTLAKSVSLASTGGAPVSFAGSVASVASAANGLTVSTAGTTTFGGNVGESLGGATALGDLTVGTGPIVIKATLVNTSGAVGQTYGGPVSLGANVWINSGNAATAAPVTFASTVDSLAAPVNLAVNASGRTKFGGLVGGSLALANLWTNPGDGRADTGNTRFDATLKDGQSTVRTVGAQIYADDVVLGQNAVLTSTANGAISFSRTVNSAPGAAKTLATVTGGTTTFSGNVGGVLGGTVSLGGLSISGPTLFNATASLVNTSGVAGQSYGGPVTIGTNLTINSGDASTAGPVTFASTIDSLAAPVNLAVNASGRTKFGHLVGGKTALANLWTNPGFGRTDAGNTRFDAVLTPTLSTVRTVGAQVFSDDVILNANAVFTSTAGGAITFGRTVTAAPGSAVSLATVTSAATTFGGNVGGGLGGAASLGSLKIAGPTVINGAQVNTSGLEGQSYGGPVTVGTNLTINSGDASTAGPVTFASTVDSLVSPVNVALNASGQTTFGGPVGSTAPLSNLWTRPGYGRTDAGVTRFNALAPATSSTVSTVSAQVYEDAVFLGADTTFDTGTAGTLAFRGALDGAAIVTFKAGAGAIALDGAVGAATVLRGMNIVSAGSVHAAGAITLAGADPAAATDGLVIGAGVNSVAMAATKSSIFNFRSAGIRLAGGSTNSTLAGFEVAGNGNGVIVHSGSYAGSRLQGNKILNNGDSLAHTGSGILLDAAGGSLSGLLVGGGTASEGNTISGNRGNGVETTAGNLAGVTLAGNMIKSNGDVANNSGNGILVRGSNLMIGWDTAPFPKVDDSAPAPSNTITGNGLNGIEIAAGSGNSILSNAIFKNGRDMDPGAVGKGISLGATKNGNDSQVAPEIRKVVWDHATGFVRVQVVVPAEGQFFVQLFRNLPKDEAGVPPVDINGFEGRALVAPVGRGQPLTAGKPVMAGAGVIAGNLPAVFEIPGTSLDAGDWLTATATNLTGTTPGSSSEFSKAAQVIGSPALAVGGDSFGATWNPEYAYTLSPTTPGYIRVENLTTTQVEVLTVGTAITLTSTATSAVVQPGVISAVTKVSPSSVDLQVLPGSPITLLNGTFVVGSSSLPAARLYDTSVPTSSPRSILRTIDEVAIGKALSEPIPGPSGTLSTIPNAQVNAFLARFQGGMRVASADFDGDGVIDIVTVPGGVPQSPSSGLPLASEFGDTLRVVTIYNGDPNGEWTSTSFNLGSLFNADYPTGEALLGQGTYTGGFLVTVGDVLKDVPGSQNAVTELIVASSSSSTTAPHRVVVLDVTRKKRDGLPTISAAGAVHFHVPAPDPLFPWSITGVTTGAFSSVQGRSDILVATTKAQPGDWIANQPITNTAAVTVYSPLPSGGFQAPWSFFINALVQNGPPANGGADQNVFLYGAGLAAGDINDDNAGHPDLVLGARTMGLANFRVIPYEALTANPAVRQGMINAALSKDGTFAQPPRSSQPSWQPQGGPDFFTPGAVPMPIGDGYNAPLNLAVVESDGATSGAFKAEVFAALGAANQSNNVIRSFIWEGSPSIKWRQGNQLKVVEIDRNRLASGQGLWLG